MAVMPEGSKITEAQVLRRYARNIRYAALLRTTASAPFRQEWIRTWRRIRALEARP